MGVVPSACLLVSCGIVQKLVGAGGPPTRRKTASLSGTGLRLRGKQLLGRASPRALSW